ncbi:EGF-like repeat and discoidin I-like domain-containing protein 3 [Saccoglossus kowalevskii]
MWHHWSLKLVLLVFIARPTPSQGGSCTSLNPCQNGALCDDSGGIITCSCVVGFAGEYCDYQDPCVNANNPNYTPCQNGGTCQVVVSTNGVNFECICPIGFSATLCESPEANICEIEQPCNNGGACILITLQDYICQCAEGYIGMAFFFLSASQFLFYIFSILHNTS